MSLVDPTLIPTDGGTTLVTNPSNHGGESCDVQVGKVPSARPSFRDFHVIPHDEEDLGADSETDSLTQGFLDRLPQPVPTNSTGSSVPTSLPT